MLSGGGCAVVMACLVAIPIALVACLVALF